MKKLFLFLICVGLIACQNERKSVSAGDTTDVAAAKALSFKYDSEIYCKVLPSRI